MLAIRSFKSRVFTTSRMFETSRIFANAKQFSARLGLEKRDIHFSLVAMTRVLNRISVLAWTAMYTFAGPRATPWSGISDNGMQKSGLSIFRSMGLSFMSREFFSPGGSKRCWDDVSLYPGGH